MVEVASMHLTLQALNIKFFGVDSSEESQRATRNQQHLPCTLQPVPSLQPSPIRRIHKSRKPGGACGPGERHGADHGQEQGNSAREGFRRAHSSQCVLVLSARVLDAAVSAVQVIK